MTQWALVLLGFLIIVVAGIAYRLFVLERRLRRFWSKGASETSEQLLYAHTNAIERLEASTADISRILGELEKNFFHSVQKIEMKRFNPFSDTGGDQSFAIAVLDGYNNGFVLSGLYIQGRPMMYAKPIQGGVSTHKLSGEEEEVLAKAIHTSA